jgi:hypothetical protein
MNVREQSKETACDLDKEPATKPDKMSTIICNKARDAVAIELHSQQKKKAQKNLLGNSTAQKRAGKQVKITSPKMTHVENSKIRRKRSSKNLRRSNCPQSILKKDGKHQGGANSQRWKQKQKEKRSCRSNSSVLPTSHQYLLNPYECNSICRC